MDLRSQHRFALLCRESVTVVYILFSQPTPARVCLKNDVLLQAQVQGSLPMTSRSAETVV